MEPSPAAAGRDDQTPTMAGANPRIGWIDATAGIAGDMVLGALVDAGADLDAVQQVLDALAPGSVRFERRTVDRAGQQATKVDVEVLVEDPPHRRWASIRTMLEAARAGGAVPARTVELALGVFARLAQAEGLAHGVPADEVHFHEVGALDSIADVVGACEAWRQLGIEVGVGSVIAVGSGRTRAAHGDIPVPVPAVVRLALGWPTVAGDLLPAQGPAHSHGPGPGRHHGPDDPGPGHDHGYRDHRERGNDHGHGLGHGHSRGRTRPTDPPTHRHETVPEHVQGGPHTPSARQTPQGVTPGIGELATPTGVALMRGLASTPGSQPSMITEAIGVGAGTKDTPGRPNVVRVIIGRDGKPATGSPVERTPTTKATSPSRDTGARPAGDVSSAPATSIGLDADDTPESAVLLEANVDDLDPRLWPGVIGRLLEHGALDTWLTPIVMKQGRPAVTVHALVREADADPAAELIMQISGTLGVRRHPVRRVIRSRSYTHIEVRGQRIAVKIARDADGRVVRSEPEFRDVAAAAQQLRISERETLDLARAAATRSVT